MQGPIMYTSTKDGLKLKLGPISKDDLPQYIVNGGMQSHIVTRYIDTPGAQSIEDEEAWYDRMRTDKTQYFWGIWAEEKDEWKLIGGTSLGSIHTVVLKQAVSGILIFDKEYWGKGVASASHVARTYFGFNELGLVCIRSCVYTVNTASARAITNIGYVNVGFERNRGVANGKRLHAANYELINPAKWAFKAWFAGQHVPRRHHEARKRTKAVMKTARHMVSYG